MKNKPLQNINWLKRLLVAVFLLIISATVYISEISSWWLGVLAGVLLWVVLIENAWLRLVKVALDSPKLNQSVRILQISDFHNNRWVIGQILKAINNTRPDVIVLTGDIFNGENKVNQAADCLLRRLASLSVPVLLIYGNHEKRYSQSFAKINTLLPSQIIKLNQTTYNLMNEVVIAGIDYGATYSDFQLDLAKFNLLITHTPKAAHKYARQGFDLILCGHEHGGQIRLPVIGGLINSSKHFFSDLRGYPTRGLSSINRTMIYIDSGSGYSSLPLRFLCRVQISLIEVMPKAKKSDNL